MYVFSLLLLLLLLLGRVIDTWMKSDVPNVPNIPYVPNVPNVPNVYGYDFYTHS